VPLSTVGRTMNALGLGRLRSSGTSGRSLGT
jgi:hypothetical protein